MRFLLVPFSVLCLAAPGHAATLHKMANDTCIAITTALGGTWTSSAWWDTNSMYTTTEMNASYNLPVTISGFANLATTAYYISVYAWGWNGSSWTYSTGGAPGAGMLVGGNRVVEAVKNTLVALGDETSPNTTWPSGPPAGCGVDPCIAKAGELNYNLFSHTGTGTANLSDSCYEDCKTTATALWEDCIGDNCVTSIKYTNAGVACGAQPPVTGLDETPPDRCRPEIEEKIAQCGGSLKVLSYNFENCTGTCTPDSCGDAYSELLTKCGSFMAISTWDATTCKGTCVNDPVPVEPGPTETPPAEVSHTEVVKPDGSKEVTNTSTYYNAEEDYTYTNSTTTNYDPSGTITGTSTNTTKEPGNQTGDGEGEGEGEPSETFPGIAGAEFGEPYGVGEGPVDSAARFSTFLDTVKSSPLFSFSNSFFSSIPGGGSSTYTIEGGETFGTHTLDLSALLSSGLAVLKSVLMVAFGFLSIRAIIMKR